MGNYVGNSPSEQLIADAVNVSYDNAASGLAADNVQEAVDEIVLESQGAKAWVAMTTSGGTPSITDSFNVSSITDEGVGVFTVNFATSFPSTNYVVCGMADNSGRGATLSNTARTVNDVRVRAYQGAESPRDPQHLGIAIFSNV